MPDGFTDSEWGAGSGMGVGVADSDSLRPQHLLLGRRKMTGQLLLGHNKQLSP